MIWLPRTHRLHSRGMWRDLIARVMWLHMGAAMPGSLSCACSAGTMAPMGAPAPPADSHMASARAQVWTGACAGIESVTVLSHCLATTHAFGVSRATATAPAAPSGWHV